MSNEDPFPQQTREVICNLYKHYNERKSMLLCEQCDNVDDVPKMVSDITGISDADIKRIIKEEEERRNESGSAPRSLRRRRQESKVKINKFTKVVIKREMAYYYQRLRQFPSVIELIKILEDKGVLQWKYEYMRRILEHLGFRLKRRSQDHCQVIGFK